MLAGIDTSFFFALAAGDTRAVEAWESRDLLTSALCFYELSKKRLKGDLKDWPAALEDIAKAVEVAPLTAAAGILGGRIAHGTGMPAFDALILATFLEAGCSEVLTLDHHFRLFAKKGLTITLLKG